MSQHDSEAATACHLPAATASHLMGPHGTAWLVASLGPLPLPCVGPLASPPMRPATRPKTTALRPP